MLSTILISVVFVASILFMCWNLIRLYSYEDFKKKRIELPSLERTEEIRNELERLINISEDPISMLEGFLESLKFHDRMLDKFFKINLDCDHLSITESFSCLIRTIEAKIEQLREGV